MSQLSLSAYTIRVKEKWKRSFGVPLNDFDDHHDLYETMAAFLEGLQVSASHDAAQKRLMQVGPVRKRASQRIFEGIIRTGEYGYEAELINADSGSISYTRKTKDAEIIPFYYLMSLPIGADEGILLLQRFRQFGIRKILLGKFVEYFKNNHEGFTIQFSPMLHKGVLDILENGKLDAIHVVRHTVPTDIADRLHIPHEEVDVQYSLFAKNRTTSALQGWLRRLLESGKNNYSIAELEELVPDYDTVKLQVELGDGKKRTMDLKKLKLRATYDISDQVRLQANGHPSFEDISRAGIDLLGSLNNALGRE